MLPSSWFVVSGLFLVFGVLRTYLCRRLTTPARRIALFAWPPHGCVL